MPTAWANRRDNFQLPFPARGWANDHVYKCQVAEGVWARVFFDLEGVRLSFWSHCPPPHINENNLQGCLRRPEFAELDLILITALIHDFINNNVPADRRFTL